MPAATKPAKRKSRRPKVAINVPPIIEERKRSSDGSVIVKRYRKGDFLGKGGFAECYVFTDLATHEVWAGKVVAKASLQQSRAKQKLIGEIKIHRSIRQENVVQFHSFFEDTQNVYILLELCPNQTMMELLKARRKPNEALTEMEAQYYMIQLVSGLMFLHQQGIIHRDLKLGNIFLGEGMRVKLGDFGLACQLEFDGEKKQTMCGTPNYIAPEILDGRSGHSFEVDIWSLGVILFTLLVGKPPFETNDVNTTYKRIKSNVYKFPSHVKVSNKAKDLIASILKSKPDERPDLTQIMNHPFFDAARRGLIPAELPASTFHGPPVFAEVGEDIVPTKRASSSNGGLGLRAVDINRKPDSASKVKTTKQAWDFTKPGSVNSNNRFGGSNPTPASNTPARIKTNIVVEATSTGRTSPKRSSPLSRDPMNRNNGGPIPTSSSLAATAASALAPPRSLSNLTSAATKPALTPSETTPVLNLNNNNNNNNAYRQRQVPTTGHIYPSSSITGSTQSSTTVSSTSNQFNIHSPTPASTASTITRPAVIFNNHSSNSAAPMNSETTSSSNRNLNTLATMSNGVTSGSGGIIDTHNHRFITHSGVSPSASGTLNSNPHHNMTPQDRLEAGVNALKVGSNPTKHTETPQKTNPSHVRSPDPPEEIRQFKHIHNYIDQSFRMPSEHIPTNTRITDIPNHMRDNYRAVSNWVCKHVDYSSRYGIGYILLDGSVGVFFNDTTRMIVSADGEHVEYYEREKASAQHSVRTSFLLSSFPEHLSKKVTLLKHFKGYLLKQLEKRPDPNFEAYKRKRAEGLAPIVTRDMPHVRRFSRTSHAWLFRFSNKTFQVTFEDESTVILSPNGKLVSFVDKTSKHEIHTLERALTQKDGPALYKRLKYTQDLLRLFITGQKK